MAGDPGIDAAARPDDLPAGELGAWLDATAAALAGTVDAAVPCGECTACCTSSQFVHVAPDEVDALAHLPAELLVAAPGLPEGHLLLGYDEHGRCPMLVDGRCSVYAHRPRTCRTYDCRVYAATGVAVDVAQPRIAERVARWRFEASGPDAAVRADALEAAVAALRDHATELGVEAAVARPSRLAVLAVQVHGAFVRSGSSGRPERHGPSLDELAARVDRVRTAGG